MKEIILWFKEGWSFQCLFERNHHHFFFVPVFGTPCKGREFQIVKIISFLWRKSSIFSVESLTFWGGDFFFLPAQMRFLNDLFIKIAKSEKFDSHVMKWSDIQFWSFPMIGIYLEDGSSQ